MHQIRTFPRLNRLELDHVLIQSPLCHSFSCPQLKHLVASSLNLDPMDPRMDSDALEHAESAFFDDLFFQGIPKLETLSLKRILVTSRLTECLKSCHSLKNVSLSNCPTQSLIPTFLDSMVDKRFLPALEELHVSESWPESTDVTYTNFVDQLSTTRPSVILSGDDNPFWFPEFD
ncbi:hypothetical protein CPB86DRAFT_57646 [Serendipita vermifera]|nr:hypothetical protein CPB86DRAFT_57646 [Serendipita vermifera]